MTQKKNEQANKNILTDLINDFVSVIEFLMQRIASGKIVEDVNFILERFGIIINGKKDKRVQITERMLYSSKTTAATDAFGFSTNTNRDFPISEIPFERHTIILGMTSMGKSNALLNIMDHGLKTNKPIIYFDPKGNLSTVEEFRSLCLYYDVEPIIFSETRLGNATFNPLKGLDNSQIVSLIANSFEWGTGDGSFYKNRTFTLIQGEILNKLRDTKKTVSFPEIYRLMQSEYGANKDLSGFHAQLGALMDSPFGKLFEDHDNSALSLYDVISDKRSVYFGLSVQGYGPIARTIGKIFLSEIQRHSHHIGLQHKHANQAKLNPIFLIVDEAGSILYEEFINLQNKGRSSGFNIILSSQTVSDFEAVSPIFKKQIFGNTGNIITFVQPENVDAEATAKNFGTYRSTKKTKAIREGEITEDGSFRETREYLVNPQIIKDLGVGSCILSTKAPNRLHLINVKDAMTLDSIKKAYRTVENTELYKITKAKRNVITPEQLERAREALLRQQANESNKSRIDQNSKKSNRPIWKDHSGQNNTSNMDI